MYRTSRPLALLLVVALLAALPSVQAMAIPAAGHPARCHEPAPADPSPAPSNYQCCVSGHHWAIPAGSFSPDPMIAWMFVPAVHGDLPEFISRQSSAQPVIPFSSPPDAAPLRI